MTPDVGERRDDASPRERASHVASQRRTLWTVVVLVTALAFIATTPAPIAAADVTADCADDPASTGNDGGAAFVADSGFTVYYDDTEPMPESGVFLNDSAMHFRNVTLVGNGSASLRLVNGTGEATCYGAVDATATPVDIAPADGGTSLVVDGTVDSLSIGPASVDDGDVTLAYESSAAWAGTVGVSEADGTDLVAEDAADGSTLAEGTVSDGAVALTFPAGSHDVALASPSSGGDSGSPTASATPSEPDGESGEAGQEGAGTGGATSTTQPTSSASPTATAPSTAATSGGSNGETEGGAVAAGARDGSIPILWILFAVAAVGAVTAVAMHRYRG